MSRAPSASLLRALRNPQGAFLCSRCSIKQEVRSNILRRPLHTNSSTTDSSQLPFRQQLKQQAKRRRNAAVDTLTDSVAPVPSVDEAELSKWELTVGIEVHAELATSTKLFSRAINETGGTANSHVSLFDIAFPGAQPELQREVLLPAIRAALALGCKVNRKSSWDRKHYFWWDQPNGYQITQYYEPFATSGSLTLHPHDIYLSPIDNSAKTSSSPTTIGIKQIQLEQDTAKTIIQPPSSHLLDFNRASVPLIEIITLPQIHDPLTAAAFVRKVQAILRAVGANTLGMEMGGLRADVNVSVRRKGDASHENGYEYAGVRGLGQRTEIKNLSSFAAISDAINAEFRRQVGVLSSGGTILHETRGWTIGDTTVHLIRSKEGEVDYRYMPDPDLPPLLIDNDLVQHLYDTLPTLPDESLRMLTHPESDGGGFSLSHKDAKTLISLDDGIWLDYCIDTTKLLRDKLEASGERAHSEPLKKAGKTVANWVLHDLPSALASLSAQHAVENVSSSRPRSTPDHGIETSESDQGFTEVPPGLEHLPASRLADILYHLLCSHITIPSARQLTALHLQHASESDSVTVENHELSVDELIKRHNLLLTPLSDEDYEQLSTEIIAANPKVAHAARDELQKSGGRKKGKLMFLVGQAVRSGELGSIQPERAEAAMKEALDSLGRDPQ